MCHSPNRLRQLNRLFACTIGPKLHCAVIAACDNLTCVEAIHTKDKAIMTLEVHHVGAIERPKFDNLVIGDRDEAVELGYFAEATNDVIMRQELFLHDAVVPESYFLVLAARDGDSIWHGQNRDSVRMPAEGMLDLRRLYVPNLRCAVPRTADKFRSNAL